MTRLVQVAVAGGVTEAEEIREMLRSAGIDSRLETAVEDVTPKDDAPQKVLVAESELDAALEAIEALSEPDELLGE
jgi:NADPH-dependent 2,4-dienoyl-CoA reductase/sulfur reductase-like enzyme